jgi:hypothetical protein
MTLLKASGNFCDQLLPDRAAASSINGSWIHFLKFARDIPVPKSAMGFWMMRMLWAEGGFSACFAAHGRRLESSAPPMTI